ncbi:MAG: methyltransferase domain-containing protein [Streptosporangiales bacterium]|nr:methyltransferase domain-containing protein [Streptosporangiales bacterium]
MKMTTAAHRKARIAEEFNRVSATYDQVGVPFFTPLGRQLVELADPRPGDRVLDVGCGRGACLFPAAERVGPTGEVIGIDLAADMVRETAAEASQRRLRQVRVLEGDAEAPDLPPESHDVVLAGLALFFLPDPAAAVRAYGRLLRPNGRLAVSWLGRDEGGWQRALNEAVVPFLRERPARRPRQDAGSPFRTVERLETLVRSAGFTDVHTSSIPHDLVFADHEQWWAWAWSAAPRPVLEHVAPERLEDARAALRSVMEQFRDPDGRLVLRLVVHYTLAARR